MPSGFVFENNQYTGSWTDSPVLPAVADSVTFGNSPAGALCTMHDVAGIKNILKANQEVKIQNATTQFNADGQMILNYTDTQLEPLDLSIMIELPKKQLYESYPAFFLQGKGTFKFGELTPDTRYALYEMVKQKNTSNIEELAWNGNLFDAANYTADTLPNGWIPRLKTLAPNSQKVNVPVNGRYTATAISASGVLTMAATTGLEQGDIVTIQSAPSTTIDGDTIVGMNFQVGDVGTTTVQLYPFDGGDAPTITGAGSKTITFATINKSSVFEALGTALRVFPRKVKNPAASQGKIIIAVPSHVATAYFERLTFNGNAQVQYLDKAPDTFDGNLQSVRVTRWQNYTIAIVPGMAPNTIVAYNTANFHFGSNLMTDFASINFIDMANSNGDQSFRVRVDFAIDTAITYANETAIVYPKLA